MRTTFVAFVVASAMSAGAAQAADRFVSTTGNDQAGANTCLGPAAPCRTIGNALANASSGDVIKVARGAYRGSLLIEDSGTWTIRGGYGMDFTEATRDVVRNRTTVTGDKKRTFLWILSGVGGTAVVLDGLVVSNSKTDGPGGGIVASVVDDFITLSLNAVTMTGNSAETGGALAFFSDFGHIAVQITSSVFKTNTARALGGAIFIDSRDSNVNFSIEDSRFENNRGGTGGAISMSIRGFGTGRLNIFRSMVLRNSAILATGGAIDVWTHDDPPAGTNGGRGALRAENSVLQDNRAKDSGGAIALRTLVVPERDPAFTAEVRFDLRNNTIAANRAADSGGGLAVLAYGVDGVPTASSLVAGTLLNNIIRSNIAPGLTASSDILWQAQGDSAAVQADLITNNIGKAANLGAALTLTPDPQLNVDPLLVQTRGVFRLRATSPMIDAGTCDGAPADDFEGDPRPTGTGLCGVDIGADQF